MRHLGFVAALLLGILASGGAHSGTPGAPEAGVFDRHSLQADVDVLQQAFEALHPPDLEVSATLDDIRLGEDVEMAAVRRAISKAPVGTEP